MSCSNIFAIYDNGCSSPLLSKSAHVFQKSSFFTSWRHYMLEIQTWKLSKCIFTGNNGTALVKLQGQAISYFQQPLKFSSITFYISFLEFVLSQKIVWLRINSWNRMGQILEFELQKKSQICKNLPVRVESPRSYLADTFGYSFNFLPLKLISPVCWASSKTLSKVRESDVGDCPPAGGTAAMIFNRKFFNSYCVCAMT